jgi:glycosylphosphatidylinositol transamidase
MLIQMRMTTPRSFLMLRYVEQFERILQSLQLKTGKQYYELPEDVFGIGVNGTNVYGILRAPRGDATEVIVLSTSWKTLDGQTDLGGVSLLMSLARYFKRNSALCIEC